MDFEELLDQSICSDVGAFHKADAVVLVKLATRFSSNVLHKQLNLYTEHHNLAKIAQILDLCLSAALEKYENQAELFFALLESTMAMLPLKLACEFWEYLEKRHSFIAELAQGSNSILLLRTCRSFLAQLDCELYKEESGRVLQFLAITKGFAHPSRLNKKSKPRLSNSRGFREESKGEISPFTASQILLNLSSLSREDSVSFLKILHQKTENISVRGAEIMDCVVFDHYKWHWSDINADAGYRLLAEQILIALSTIAPNSCEDEELQLCISKLTDNCRRILEPDHKMQLARVFESEALWKNWKQSQCPYIEYKASTSITGAEAHGTTGEDSFLLGTKEANTPLLSSIGNARLTRLLQAQVTRHQYYTTKNSTLEAASLRAEAETRENSKSLRDSMAFLASRCEPWQRILEKQAAEPRNEHEELQPLEAELFRAQKPAASTAIKRSTAVSQDSAPKRPRISYEDDTRYQDRQRGLQTTTRPLPY